MVLENSSYDGGALWWPKFVCVNLQLEHVVNYLGGQQKLNTPNFGLIINLIYVPIFVWKSATLWLSYEMSLELLLEQVVIQLPALIDN